MNTSNPMHDEHQLAFIAVDHNFLDEETYDFLLHVVGAVGRLPSSHEMLAKIRETFERGGIEFGVLCCGFRKFGLGFFCIR
jgi:hypothetical protein